MKKRNLFVHLMLVVFTMISINVWAGDEESFMTNRFCLQFINNQKKRQINVLTAAKHITFNL